ncbi:glycogen synthase GlgA [bacterium]|nr:glycogen synthase GlgA [bacterium]
MPNNLNILFAASEVVPFAKTGGLADVAGALPVALEELGHKVKVVMPYYQMVKKSRKSIKDTEKSVLIEINDRIVEGKIYQSKIGKNVTVYLIENEAYYNRQELYRTTEGDYPDNAERYIFFSKAVLEVAKIFKFQPDIVHCNDWQTGLVPVLLKVKEQKNPFFENTASVFTIHNLAYQGLFWHLDMPLTNLPWSIFNQEGIEYYGNINLMKAGIVFSDVVNTVSKKYSKEIQTEEFGCGLEGVLQNRQNDLYGIVNGVDYSQWNPESDKLIKSNFSSSDLNGKKVCREDLLQEFGLKNKPSAPIIGIISRLADQKGFDLLAEQINAILQFDLFLVLLGTGEEKYHVLFKEIAKKYSKKVGIKLTFDNTVAHKIEAGSDIFLMPSQYEPCGLNQMYSLKYGTIPVVRATGGLDDTITNYNPKNGKGNGFKFKPYTGKALLSKIEEAVTVYKSKKDWKKLLVNAFECDFSWNASAREYSKLYLKALEKKVINRY